ncbi:MAG: hypothetical protein ACI808_002631, partial [Paraglaciecola sp.]
MKRVKNQDAFKRSAYRRGRPKLFFVFKFEGKEKQ